MTTITTRPLLARTFLAEDDVDANTAIVRSLEQHGVVDLVTGLLGGLTRTGRSTAAREIASTVRGLLDVDIGDVVVGAWSKHSAVIGAARHTASSQGRELVRLATHRITSRHRPHVEILLDQQPVATVRCELTIELVIGALLAVVAHGKLVGLDVGQCDATVRLGIEGHDVLERSKRIDLGLGLDLGDGIPLLR